MRQGDETPLGCGPRRERVQVPGSLNVEGIKLRGIILELDAKPAARPGFGA